jgi:hypothetical protein
MLSSREYLTALMNLPGNREQPRPGGGWSKIGIPARRESGQTGTNNGVKGRFRLNWAARLGTMAARGVINGKSRLDALCGSSKAGMRCPAMSDELSWTQI